MILDSTDTAAASTFGREVLDGLSAHPRTLPAKYFYDERGSRLFDAITRLDAYYPTRTERQILLDHGDEMVDAIGKNAALVEYGSGSSDKTRILLDALHARRTLAAYVPIDISKAFLHETADGLRAAYPGLPVLPVAADYTTDFDLPTLPPETSRIVVFFPGSTIGNFTTEETATFLAHVADVIGDDGALLVGMDQWKDDAVLRQAYDDPEGVTADFNLNLLRRINAELKGDADLSAWAHEVRLDAERQRVEMHLQSLESQTLTVLEHPFTFSAGDTIHTENSHKFGPDGLGRLAESAGLVRRRRWTDARDWFAVELYEAREVAPR